MVFTESICRCEAPPECPEVENRTCPTGQRFDLISCQCVDICNITCDSPKFLNYTSCECECPPSPIPRELKCPGLLVFDEETCFCKCPNEIACEPNEVLMHIHYINFPLLYKTLYSNIFVILTCNNQYSFNSYNIVSLQSINMFVYTKCLKFEKIPSTYIHTYITNCLIWQPASF